jgi:hypothetical protein
MAEAPTVGAALARDGQVQAAAPATAPDQSVQPIAPNSDQPKRRNRRRRRRRRPRPDAVEAGSSTAGVEGSTAIEKAPAHQAVAERSSATTTEQAAPTQPATENAPPKRRRRRRRRRRPEGVVLPTATRDPTSVTPGAAIQSSAATEPKEPQPRQARRDRERRDRPSREDRSRDRENRREQSRDPRVGEDRGAGVRDIRRPWDKRGARGPKDRHHQRDRDVLRKKPEPKLYRLESIVDRGFEDVADPATEGATRRVDWTILKRTTADQHTTRASSVIYVLRRDGIDTEFAHLSAARAAVNKTITHPEKLTPSKADHAAGRSGKK